jgi:hypothetical protein
MRTASINNLLDQEPRQGRFASPRWTSDPEDPSALPLIDQPEGPLH